MQKKAIVYYCSEQHHAVRIDLFLSELLGISRALIEKKIHNKLIFINKFEAKKKSQKIFLGDMIEVFPFEEKQLINEKTHFPIDIIYKNQNFLIINKPSGILSHGDLNNKSEEYTIADFALQFWNGEVPEIYKKRIGIVHRLDKETSGAMIIARNLFAMNYFIELFKLREVKKKYIAYTQVNNDVSVLGVVDFNIVRDPLCPIKMTHAYGQGKAAETQYNIIKKSKEFFVVVCTPTTGRMHQIRVHLKSVSLPIIGDTVYGKKSALISRCALHAASLDFFYGKESFSFYALLPDDMNTIYQKEFGVSIENNEVLQRVLQSK